MDWKFWIRWKLIHKIMRPFRAFGRFLTRVFTVYRMAIVLALVAFGLKYVYEISISELLPNIVTDLLGVALTVFIIDTMYKVRSDKERKKVLISKLGSKNNSVASDALSELDARGWLSDGTLEGVFLISANLDGNSLTGANLRRASLSFASLRDTTWFEADLRGAHLDYADLKGASLSQHAIGPHYAEADLTGAVLSNADLTNAEVRHEQLMKTRSLLKAIMPDGTIYDGRYNLKGDRELFLKLAANPKYTADWAEFYGVTTEKFRQGQEWAKSNPDINKSFST